MIKMHNGAIVLKADLSAAGSDGYGLTQGVVLTRSHNDYVTWKVVFDDDGWHAFSGNYFTMHDPYAYEKALSDYNQRRGAH